MSAPRPEAASLIAEAAGAADRLVERFPYSPASHDVKAWSLFRFGNSAEAVKRWRRCVELDSTFSAAYYWIGRCAFDREDYSQAAECFRTSLDAEPDSVVYPLYLANALMRLARFEDAVAVLQRDVKAHPGAMPSHVLLGQAHLHLQQYQEARRSLEKAIAVAPDYTSAHYALATACERLGDKERAKQCRATFRSLKERDQKLEREALMHYDDVVKVRQGAAHVHASAARVYAAHGDTSEAEAHVRKAAELDPANPKYAGSHKPTEPKAAHETALPGLY